MSSGSSILPLWERLTSELAGVFDTHFVCATIAAEVAAFTGAVTVVGVSRPQRDCFDVWICRPDRSLTQVRWREEQASFAPIINSGPIENGQALRLDKLDRPVSELVKSELWLMVQDSFLGVPLPYLTTDELPADIGLLGLIDPPETCALGTNELESLSRALTVYYDRAALRRRVDQQEIEFAVVSDISHILTSTLSMERVFQELRGTIRHILQVEALSVGLIDQNSGEVVFLESLMGVPSENLPIIRLKQGQGIAGWVADHGQPVIVNDTYADRRFDPLPDRRSGFKTNSVICIPLRVEERTIGVLQAINRRYGQFTARDLSLVEAIGGPLAAAIENSKLHTDVLSEKRRVETILSGMSDGLLAVTLDGYITRLNDAFLALLLGEDEQLVGRPVEDVLFLQGGSITALVEATVRQEDVPAQMAVDLQRRNGDTIPVLISGAPILGEHDQVKEVIFTFSDLSQVREVERMRDDLFQAIAHELRTPLATILMYARLLLEGKAQDEEKAARFLSVIERESNRLQAMVRRMMQLAKQESKEFHRRAEPIRVNPLLDDVLPPMIDQAVQKGLYFRPNIEKDLPAILGDEERLEEIVRNLVDNAIKFSQSGTIHFAARRKDDQIELEISDQGIGIAQQALPYLFNRFYRAQSAVDRGIAGSGLGLYMVKQSVEQYNGSISVSSTVGEGTTFTVRFPISEDF